MKAHKNGRWSIPVIEIYFTFELHPIPDRLRATKPLNASFEIAANYMSKVFSRKLFILTLRLSREAETKVHEDNMFATTGKRI
jgi:hypothetical protein